MTLQEACKEALTILKQVMEEKLSATNVEVLMHSFISFLLSRKEITSMEIGWTYGAVFNVNSCFSTN